MLAGPDRAVQRLVDLAAVVPISKKTLAPCTRSHKVLVTLWRVRGLELSPISLENLETAASMPSVPPCFNRRSCSSRHLLGSAHTGAKAWRASLDIGLHFSLPTAIRCVATDARAPTIGGDWHLAYLFEEYHFDTDGVELHRGRTSSPSRHRYSTCSTT